MKKSLTAATLMSVTLQATYSIESAWAKGENFDLDEANTPSTDKNQALDGTLPDVMLEETTLAASSVPLAMASEAYGSRHPQEGQQERGNSRPTARGAPITNYIFATSETGTGFLGGWPSAPIGAQGLAAADGICQTEAAAAGLASPGNYVAWLSDQNDDAWCRVHGLSGKKISNCGVTPLPFDPGPWVRLDDYPFSGNLSELTLDSSGLIYAPVEFDPVQFAAMATTTVPRDAWTGTNSSGTFIGAGLDCDFWGSEDSAYSSITGNLDSTTSSWTHNNTVLCATAEVRRLICLAKGSHAPLPDPVPTRNYIFASDARGNGVIGAWVGAGGATGVAAADNICQSEAAASGLANPNSYVAWLSDSSNDAYCRAHGRDGLVSANCNLPTLPTGAGPWNRLDNLQFGGTLNEIIYSNLIYSPVRLDINHATDAPRDAWTGSNASGIGVSATCEDWSLTTPLGTIGNLDAVTDSWTDSGASGCDNINRLICLGGGAQRHVRAPYTERARLAFVSSTFGNGDFSNWSPPIVRSPAKAHGNGLSGIAGADNICTTLAQNVGLPKAEDYKAWISDDITNAIDRFQNDSPIYRIDGVRIADSFAELTSSYLQSTLHINEFRQPIDRAVAWTSTNTDGTSSAASCQNWSSESNNFTATVGFSWLLDGSWTSGGAAACDLQNRVYCFSDKDELELLGFE